MTAPRITMPDGWESELLDWVSACQSAYHIDNTQGHRFGGLGSNLEENRAALIEYVEGLLAAAPEAPAVRPDQSEQPLEMVNAPAPSVPDADLVRDAERYRWLRTYNTAKHPAVTEAFFLGDENLDAEIDAAIAAEKGGA